jgi:hypothetical protein
MKSVGIIYALVTFSVLISMKQETKAVFLGDCSKEKKSAGLVHLTRGRVAMKKNVLPTRKKSSERKKINSDLPELQEQIVNKDLSSDFTGAVYQPKKIVYNSKSKKCENTPLGWDNSTKLVFSAAAISCLGFIWYLMRQEVNRSRVIKA